MKVVSLPILNRQILDSNFLRPKLDSPARLLYNNITRRRLAGDFIK